MLRYGKFTFLIEFETEAQFPEYKGGILRGALGKSLRDICCPIKRQECSSCLLSKSCIYFFIFETKVIKNSKKSPYRPPPFVLEVIDNNNISYSEGEKLNFNIILIEDAIKYLPYIVYSIINMGRRGIGFKVKEGKGKFKLVSVTTNDTKIYSNGSQEISIPEKFNYLQLDISNQNKEISKIKVDFITPYRVKYKNSLVSSFDFSIFIRACLRRISQLEETYIGTEPELDYKGLVMAAKEIETVELNKKWFEIRRYSYRQHSKMRLGGLIGSAYYEGNLTNFIPILKYCEIMHVGKQTSFGFGKFTIVSY